MKTRTRTEHDPKLRGPRRHLAGERAEVSLRPDPEPTDRPSEIIRARRARLSFTWPPRKVQR